MPETTTDTATFHDLEARWAEAEAAHEAAWVRQGRPGGKAWNARAREETNALYAAEDALGAALLAWAEENGCGQFRDGSGALGFVGWFPEPGCYDRIRAGTGLELHGQLLRRLLETGGYPRAVAHAAQNEEEWRQFVHAMPAEDWPDWIEGYCASSPEGRNTKKLLVRLRAELDEG